LCICFSPKADLTGLVDGCFVIDGEEFLAVEVTFNFISPAFVFDAQRVPLTGFGFEFFFGGELNPLAVNDAMALA